MIMKKRLLITLSIFFFIFSLSTCRYLSEAQKKEYGILSSAVTFSSDKVFGKYSDAIPDDLDSIKFLELVKDRIPEDYYLALTKYHIDIEPKKTYYLLKIYHKKDLILFDYSCTPKVDGAVLLNPEKYDLNNLGLYDECKDSASRP